MAVETDIPRGMIRAALDAIEPLGLPIKVPGRTFEPSVQAPDGRYIELLIISNNSLLSTPRLWVGASMTWGDEQLYSGIVRIILHWPIDETGIYDQTDILAAIKAEFFKGRVIFSGEARLTIYDNPSITDPIDDDGKERLFPLTVPYQYFHHA